MKINGLMIDCCRIIERHDYYFRLLDFMADQKMNMLVLHFSDDSGLSVQLPGFEDIAMKNSFTAKEVKSLIAHAGKLGIDIVPEIETFGHTKFITGLPHYAHLRAGKRKKSATGFNAIDPLNPETLRVMRKLIASTTSLFPSAYVHIGCDEVDMTAIADLRPGIDTAAVWSDYVNKILAVVRQHNRTPIFWADHAVKDQRIAESLDKNSIALWWDYVPDVPAAHGTRLTKAGFKRIITGPAIAWCMHRYHPAENSLKNLDTMARHTTKQKLMGMISTVWCPFRYLQDTIWYGIAYAAETAKKGGRVNRAAFNKQFADKMFGAPLTKSAAEYLAAWPSLDISHSMSRSACSPNKPLEPGDRQRLKKVSATWRRVRSLGLDYRPKKNTHVWDAMRLAGDAAGVTAENVVLARGIDKLSAARITLHNETLGRVRKEIAEAWDATRFPNDPMKNRPKESGDGFQFALLIVRALKLLPPPKAAKTRIQRRTP